MCGRWALGGLHVRRCGGVPVCIWGAAGLPPQASTSFLPLHWGRLGRRRRRPWSLPEVPANEAGRWLCSNHSPGLATLSAWRSPTPPCRAGCGLYREPGPDPVFARARAGSREGQALGQQGPCAMGRASPPPPRGAASRRGGRGRGRSQPSQWTAAPEGRQPGEDTASPTSPTKAAWARVPASTRPARPPLAPRAPPHFQSPLSLRRPYGPLGRSSLSPGS